MVATLIEAFGNWQSQSQSPSQSQSECLIFAPAERGGSLSNLQYCGNYTSDPCVQFTIDEGSGKNFLKNSGQDLCQPDQVQSNVPINDKRGRIMGWYLEK